MSIDLTTHLTDLSEAVGLSGYETPIRQLIESEWERLADDLRVDALGNLFATRYATTAAAQGTLLIATHMDEIGLMVSSIDGAFLRVTSVGGIDKRVMIGQTVVVHGSEDLLGLVGSRPPHVLPAEDRKKYPDLSDLVIDTGLTAEEVSEQVRIGDLVSIDQKAVKLNGDLLCGKSMDNRASVACATLILEGLQSRSFNWNVVVAATVQEEVGLKGATTAAWGIAPHLALAIDVGFATGNGVGEDSGFKLGGGPTIMIGPNAHPKLFDRLRQTAKKLELPLHPEPAPRGTGTDGYAIQISRSGVPTAVLSIPIRNMHTPVEIASLKDIERTARIVVQFISELDDQTLHRLSLDAEEAAENGADSADDEGETTD
ncbi:MAG: M42 family metallopeptidase [Chloroflexi bacterium]|nr:M42 family metallopeptidase [Chloroflexota bacterium]